MEDYDAEEEDEEALIEQRRQQRLAIVQVSSGTSKPSVAISLCSFVKKIQT